MVKNPPSKAGDSGSIPGQGTKIPYTSGQLSPCSATTESVHSRAQVPQLENLSAATKSLHCNEELLLVFSL